MHVDGRVGRLSNYYMHTPYTDIAHQIRTIDRYSGAFAEDMAAVGPPFPPRRTCSAGPSSASSRDYMVKGGFRDGVPGLVIVASTMFYVFMKHARLWELEKGMEGLKGKQVLITGGLGFIYRLHRRSTGADGQDLRSAKGIRGA